MHWSNWRIWYTELWFFIIVIGAIDAGFNLFTEILKRKVVAIRLRQKEQRQKDGIAGKKIIGFFHPYCNAGGGGERVLWAAVAHLQRTEPDVVCAIYTGDINTTGGDIIYNVKSRFNISLDSSGIRFVFLKSRKYLEDKQWPRFTLLGQSIGSMYVAYEAMQQLIPDLFIDTMGYAFTFRVVGYMGRIPVGGYVHYPTVSTNMIKRVEGRSTLHNNSNAVSRSFILSHLKILYYKLFMFYYARSLRRASFIMVNSTWTKEHVAFIMAYRPKLLSILHDWFPWTLFPTAAPSIQANGPQIVYPPCDTEQLTSLGLDSRSRTILSVAQFRPEKDHETQIRSLHRLFENHPKYQSGSDKVTLVLLGGCRNDEDVKRKTHLERLARELEVEENVLFIVNAPYSTVREQLSNASIGISTMVDEHFGINVVEYMAAGVIPVVHASGGPLKDIVVPIEGKPTGYHATNPEEYAEALHAALSLSAVDCLEMRQRGRDWAATRFSTRSFEREWDLSGWRKTLKWTK